VNAPASIPITPVRVADLLAEGERMPVYVHGMQVVVVETGGRPVVRGGDVAVWFGELDELHTEGQLRVRALDPELVWLAHEHEPWRPRPV
jgi:N-acyl homoserine lactone hydrolase